RSSSTAMPAASDGGRPVYATTDETGVVANCASATTVPGPIVAVGGGVSSAGGTVGAVWGVGFSVGPGDGAGVEVGATRVHAASATPAEARSTVRRASRFIGAQSYARPASQV